MNISQQQKIDNQIGINYTINHLNKSLIGMNNNSKQIKRPNNPNPITSEPPISKFKLSNNINNNNNNNHHNNTKNESLLLPFVNDEDVDLNELHQHFSNNLKELNHINNQLKILPSINIADKIEDQLLIQYINEYKNCKNQIYELNCIEYKLMMHISANFIPKNERLRIQLNDHRVQIKSNQNYEYIKNTLTNSAKISMNNYMLKLKQKTEKKNFYENMLTEIKNEFNKKIKDKRSKYLYNKGNIFPSNVVKTSILCNFDSEMNKAYKIITDINDNYDDKLIKYKHRTILQFDKLCTKIKINIGNNNEINYNFEADLNAATQQKAYNKNKQWIDNYDLHQNEEQQNVMKNADEEYIQYNPSLLMLNEINVVNIDNKHRKLIVTKYGNEHDKYLHKQHEKLLNQTKNYHKSRKNKKYTFYAAKNNKHTFNVAKNRYNRNYSKNKSFFQ